MKMLFNLAIGFFVWLGVFQLALVKPLLTQPLSVALAGVGFVDIVLLLLTVIVVMALLHKLDSVIDARKTKTLSTH